MPQHFSSTSPNKIVQCASNLNEPAPTMRSMLSSVTVIGAIITSVSTPLSLVAIYPHPTTNAACRNAALVCLFPQFCRNLASRIACAERGARSNTRPIATREMHRCAHGGGVRVCQSSRIASTARASIAAIRARNLGYARAIHCVGRNQCPPHNSGVMPWFAATNITMASSPANAAGAQVAPFRATPKVLDHSSTGSGEFCAVLTNQTTAEFPAHPRFGRAPG
jgi:hypothetical protein